MNIPVWLQHLLVALAATFLTWVGADGIPLLREQPGYGAILAALAAAALGYLVPVIDSYGIGSKAAVKPGPDGAYDITSGEQGGI